MCGNCTVKFVHHMHVLLALACCHGLQKHAACSSGPLNMQEYRSLLDVRLLINAIFIWHTCLASEGARLRT